MQLKLPLRGGRAHESEALQLWDAKDVWPEMRLPCTPPGLCWEGSEVLCQVVPSLAGANTYCLNACAQGKGECKEKII